MVIVYSSPSCSGCKAAKEELTDLGVAFTSVNITTNNAARNTLIENGFASVPVFEVNGEFADGLSDTLELLEKLK